MNGCYEVRLNYTKACYLVSLQGRAGIFLIEPGWQNSIKQSSDEEQFQVKILIEINLIVPL